MESHAPARLTRAEGRRFALTLAVAFGILAGVAWWRGHGTTALVLVVPAVALAAAGILVPRRLGPLQRAWMGGAEAISRVTTPVLLVLVYFLAVVPIGLLMKLLRRDPLRHDARGESYWIERTTPPRPESMERQF